MKKTILSFTLFAALALESFAANVYVRQAASGSNNGSDWSNAYTTIAAAETAAARGDTIYIAGGTYTEVVTFNTAVSGTTLITIKHATASDHGTETGWSGSYTNQSYIDGALNFTTGYWTMDGGFRNESDWTDYANYGFRVEYTGAATSVKLISASYCDGMTFKYIDLTHVGGLGAGASDGRDIFYTLGGDNITISHCRMYNAGRTHMLLRQNDYFTLEYSYMDTNESFPIEHSESISALDCYGAVIRHNWFANIKGTGVVVWGDNTPGSGACDDWKLYGNVVYNWPDDSNGIFTCWSAEYADGAVIYNNTFVSCSNGRLGFTSTDGWTAYNNIWIDWTPQFAGTNWTHDYNAHTSDIAGESNDQIITSAIFADYANQDFTLASATDAGTTLSSPYDTDLTGATRGSDGSWDRGAYEYDAGTPPDPPAPVEGTVTVNTLIIGG